MMRQRNVAVRRILVTAAVAVPLLGFALVVPQLPPGYSWQRWLVGLPLVVWFLYGGLQPLLWWWGADLWADEDGLGFGRDRVRARPAQVTFLARNRFHVPWSAMSDARLVRDRTALRAMRKAARAGTGAPQPTAFPGFFPASGRALLVFTVDPASVQVPEIRPASRRRQPLRVAAPGLDPTATRTWAFPVRDVEALRAALGEHGIALAESDRPALPGTRVSGSGTDLGPDDPFVVETLTRNLGRPPSEEEMARIRKDWHDTERFPKRS